MFGPRSLIIMLASAITAIGCGWSLLTDHSVRFNAYRSGRGFYRLPPLPIMYEPKTGKEITVQSLNDYEGRSEDEVIEETDTAETEDSKIWNDARTAAQANDLERARIDLEKFLDLTKIREAAWPDDQRNSARDILDALESLKHGSKVEAVRAYIEVRYAAFHNQGETLEDLLDDSVTDKNLRDNWDYLRAAILVRNKKPDEALVAFQEHVAKYPSSEKHQAVLYMIAKLTMESSHSFENTACGIQEEKSPDEETSTSKAEPIENCRDAARLKAIEDFKALMRQYPNGRYFNDARGWLAYLYRRGGNRAEALAEYYRMLGDPTDWNVRLEAKKSLQIIGHAYDDETLDKVESLIADDENASMAYAYHRIYNHAIDLTYEEIDRWVMKNDDWAEQEKEERRVAHANSSGSHELERVAHFAAKMLQRHPGAHVSGAFLLRLAEARLELQNFSDALKFAKRALASGIDGDLRTEALWIKGSSEHAAKDFKNARSTFAQLVREYPNSKLTEGARRLLAMTAEDTGDLEAALEQYLALQYKYDVAYFVDVLMPTDRLARFVDSHRDDPSYNKLLYSVGVRYMRDKRWDDARVALRKVVTKNDLSPTLWNWENKTAENVFSKYPEYEWKNDEIKTGWVMQDLKTIDALENFERAIASAPDDESRAEAMYQLASFQFDGDDLLFYNPAIWKGGRVQLLSEFTWLNTMRQPGESKQLFDYSQSHETLARSIPIYLEIVNRYPNTRAAKDALYSTAVAHEKLSNFNDYWRDIYARGMFAGPRYVTYPDVKSAYPRYQLPRGTDRWEASTRTVNGGPGWAPAPKPQPRETREHKVKRLLHEFTDYVSAKITTGVVPAVESKVDSGLNWWSSIIEAAIYGVLSAIGVWALVLIGIGLHSERLRAQLLPAVKEHATADSHVDKFIE